MDISHLHLHVRDRARSTAFYIRWFGLAVQFEEDHITFLSGDRSFLLALSDDVDPPPLPAWFHFGVSIDSQDAIESLHRRMRAADVRIVRDFVRGDDFASFRCADPDGYVIESYWSNT